MASLNCVLGIMALYSTATAFRSHLGSRFKLVACSRFFFPCRGRIVKFLPRAARNRFPQQTQTHTNTAEAWLNSTFNCLEIAISGSISAHLEYMSRLVDVESDHRTGHIAN